MSWWHQFYQQEFEEILQHTPMKHYEDIAQRIQDSLSLPAASRILDQCCGLGQMSIGFAALGHRVVGIDQSENYIQSAKNLDLNQACAFLCADAFVYVAPEPCDLVLNWHTSFGYTPEDTQNSQMLQRGFESLAPGGYMMLEYYHTAHILTRFQKKFTKNYVTCAGRKEVTRYAEIKKGMLHQRWEFKNEWGDITHREGCTKMYTPEELVALFERCGFRQIACWGDPSGTPLKPAHERCLVVGVKP